MNLLALPAFADNYIWMLHDGHSALVVDPGDAAPVIEALARHALVLRGILVTHHHPDHVGGLDALRPHLQGAVWGPARERIPGPFTPVHEGDRVELLGQRFRVIEVPGHTAGHVAYAQQADAAPLLFCGDTLFSAGCGRLFEGTPAQMHDSLTRLAALPDDTRVCCTHEYTLSNLRFAAAVEPANADIAAHVATCTAWREAQQPTLPSTLSLERRINPFLRCDVPQVVQAARVRRPDAHGAIEVLAALREWKNEFR
jgi:hydroxyacylglutathione hydrolase